VLIPLIVAGIVAYVLDPVVRLLEKRGLSRLWSVVWCSPAILLGATLLVAAVVPGIQRGHHTLKNLLQEPRAGGRAEEARPTRRHRPPWQRPGGNCRAAATAIATIPSAGCSPRPTTMANRCPSPARPIVDRHLGQFRTKPRGTHAL
jgi:hypothetical protein